MPRATVLLIDPVFQDAPDVERAVWGDDVEAIAFRPTVARDAPIPHELLARADVVMSCRSRHRIGADAVAAMTRAKLVVQVGVGFNHIDVEACGRAGIPVSNTPDYGTREVADHALALTLTLMRGTAAYDRRIRESSEGWSTFDLGLSTVRRLSGLTFGVVGLGRIGLAAAQRAKAFEFAIAFHDPHLPPGAELSLGFTRFKRLDDLLAVSDVVSVHCPQDAATMGLIGTAAIGAMKPGAVLINTARGGIVDLDAVEAGLRSGHLGAAGLDVLPVEPPDGAHPLIRAWRAGEPWLAGRLIITPHAAFFTPESLFDMRRLSALAVHEFLTEGTVRSLVNGAVLAR